jgi:hypothetical protein
MRTTAYDIKSPFWFDPTFAKVREISLLKSKMSGLKSTENQNDNSQRQAISGTLIALQGDGEANFASHDTGYLSAKSQPGFHCPDSGCHTKIGATIRIASHAHGSGGSRGIGAGGR